MCFGASLPPLNKSAMRCQVDYRMYVTGYIRCSQSFADHPSKYPTFLNLRDHIDISLHDCCPSAISWITDSAHIMAQVRMAERRLRGALLLDGLHATSDWQLARYNDPFTLPALRRNEVLIALSEAFKF